jgi:AcrR family transcriptional regulator
VSVSRRGGAAGGARSGDAGVGVWGGRGCGAVTVDDVARSAGASKQTIARQFGGRDGLVAAALQLELDQVIAPMRDAAGRDGNAAERLRDFGSAYQDVLFAPRCLRLYRYVLSEVNHSPELGVAFTTLVTDYVIGLVLPAITEATDADARTAAVLADVFLGALQGVELERALAGAEPDRERLASLRVQALRAVLGGDDR